MLHLLESYSSGHSCWTCLEDMWARTSDHPTWCGSWAFMQGKRCMIAQDIYLLPL